MYETVKFSFGGRFTSRGPWQHPERIQSTTELIIMTEGTAHLELDGRHYSISQGDVLRIGERVRHKGTQYSEGVSFIWLHFTGGDGDPMPPVLSKPCDMARTELITRQLLHYANTDGYPEEAASYLIRLLLIELTHGVKDTTANAKTCAAVCHFIELNCDLPIKASDVSDHFNYNKDYLGRIFKAEKKCSLKQYIDSARLKKIKSALMDDTLTLQEISDSFSFSDYKYFLKYFKYHEGISPSEFRRSYYNTAVNNS